MVFLGRVIFLFENFLDVDYTLLGIVMKAAVVGGSL